MWGVRRNGKSVPKSVFFISRKKCTERFFRCSMKHLHTHSRSDENFPCGLCLVSIEHVLWFSMWRVNSAVMTFSADGEKMELWKFSFTANYIKLSTRIANLTVSFAVDVCVERKHVFGLATRDELKSFSPSLSSSFSFDWISLQNEGKKKCRQVVKVKVTIICFHFVYSFHAKFNRPLIKMKFCFCFVFTVIHPINLLFLPSTYSRVCFGLFASKLWTLPMSILDTFMNERGWKYAQTLNSN